MKRDSTFRAENLYNELRSVENWQGLGTYLLIPRNKLEQIEQEYYGTDDCKKGLIALILDNYPFGWKDICDALEKIDKTILANDIRIKYCINAENACECQIDRDKQRRMCKNRKLIAVIIILVVMTSCVVMLITVLSLRESPKYSTLIIESEDDLTNILGTGDIITVKFIVFEMHIDPREYKDSHGNSALMVAVRSNNLNVVKYLVEVWNWKHACSDKWSEVHEACYLGNKDLVEYFFSRNFSQCGRSLIEAAAIGGQIETLKYLISHGYQINCERHWSSMHEASNRGHLNIIKFYAQITDKDMCSLCVDEHGNNLLHAAAVARAESAVGQLAVMKYLTEEQNCDKTVHNDEGQSTLDKARQTHNQAIIEYLQ